jgi:succinate dehydrogenase / fumarate reductase cytochrome b subunit
MPAASVSPAPVRRFSPNPIVAFYQSSVGKKIVVSVTGVVLVLYVLGHLLGNLQIFLGSDQLNWYAEFLHNLGPLLWLIRFVLLACFVVHIVATIQLALENRRAKPQKYATAGYQASTRASRTMIYSGLLVLCFVIYHLMHFTLLVTNPSYRDLRDHLGQHDVYRMVVLGFQQPLISLVYAAAVFLVALHLSHGFASIPQTLGLNNQRISKFVSGGGQIISWLVFAGYALIPAVILLGLIR